MPTFKRLSKTNLISEYKQRCPDGLWFSPRNMEVWNTGIIAAWIEEPGQLPGDGGGFIPWIYFLTADRPSYTMLPFYAPGWPLTDGKAVYGGGSISLRYMNELGDISIVASNEHNHTDQQIMGKIAELGLPPVVLRTPVPHH